MMAIQAYEQALTWFNQVPPANPSSSTAAMESSTFGADVLNDLGNLYWMLSHRALDPEPRLSCLKQGISAYQIALTKVDPVAQPHCYAMIHNNLGAAYGDLARHQDPVENLQQSIASYQAALQYRGANVEPLKYAATQNNLGTAYWNLAQHQQTVIHLKQAIAAYNEALQYYNPEREPINYAMIQNNLGTTYWNLAQYEQAAASSDADPEFTGTSQEFLLRAVDAYQIALIYRTPQVAPAAYAATQNNLGTAYWHLASQTQTNHEARQNYLQQAIAAYAAALAMAQHPEQPLVLTFDLFATHNNLGLAYYQVATDPHFLVDKATQANYLESALNHHLQALQGWEQKPDFYQTALSYVVQTVRSFYSECGLQGQNLALSQLPGHLLPEIMRRL
jgi:tetratricopeptide (TPR) repeat protein